MKSISKTVTHCTPMAQVGKTIQTTDDTTVFIDKFQKSNGVGVCTVLQTQAAAVRKYQGTVEKKQSKNGTNECKFR
jgi:hypothetical protein